MFQRALTPMILGALSSRITSHFTGTLGTMGVGFRFAIADPQTRRLGGCISVKLEF